MAAPVFFSLPNFYHSDPYYISRVTGMPEGTDANCSLYLDIEPWTGLPMRGLKRIQFNVRVVPEQGIDLTSNVNKEGFYAPLFYGVQSGQITPDKAKEFKSEVRLLFVLLQNFVIFTCAQILLPLSIAYYLRITLLSLAGLFFLAFVTTGAHVLKRNKGDVRGTDMSAPMETELLLPTGNWRRQADTTWDEEH